MIGKTLEFYWPLRSRRVTLTSTAAEVLWLAVSTSTSEPRMRERVIGQRGQRLLQRKHRRGRWQLGSRWSASASARVLMSSLCDDALDLGLDPAVAVQRPVDAARHQRLVVHPGDGGGDLARRLEGARAPAASRRARRRLRGPARCRRCGPAGTVLGWRTWFSTWATVAVWPLGSTLTCWPGSMAPVATRPQNTRRPCLVSDEDGELLDPLHREGEGFGWSLRR